MDIGSIGAIALNEKDQTKINFAIRQLIARNSGAQINAVVAKSAAYTLGPSDFMVEVTGNTTITLPAASAAPGQLYCIKKMDSAATTATIGGTVDGSVNPTITVQYEVWLVQSSGTAWDRIVKYTAPVSISGLLLNTNNLSDVSNVATSRTNLGLGTAAVLDVGTAANKILQLDSSAKIPAVDGSQLTNLPAQNMAGTPLVLNPYTVSNSSSQAHGLGAVPAFIVAVLECLTADLNYSVGDKIFVNSNLYFASVLFDATNLYLVTSSVTPQLANKTTFAAANITAANWKLTITPRRLI